MSYNRKTLKGPLALSLGTFFALSHGKHGTFEESHGNHSSHLRHGPWNLWRNARHLERAGLFTKGTRPFRPRQSDAWNNKDRGVHDRGVRIRSHPVGDYHQW